MNGPVSYALYDPTGNLTLLAETPVPEGEQPAVAQALMEAEPGTEQVGFVTADADGVRLRMAGGEFCGNASMCAAAWFLERAGQERETVSVSVSGTEQPVAVRLTPLGPRRWRGVVEMPRPLSVARELFPDGHSRFVARFPGISHVLLEEAPDRAAAEALAPVWCRYLKADAVGLLFLDRAKETLTPLVYVPAADTLFWESSCASGTTAVGACLAAEGGGEAALDLAQPGGTLSVTAGRDGTLLLSGTVSLIRTGTLLL